MKQGALCGGLGPQLPCTCWGSGSQVFPAYSRAGSGYTQDRAHRGHGLLEQGGTCGWTLSPWTRCGQDSRSTGAPGRRRRGSRTVRQQATAWDGGAFPRCRSQGHLATFPIFRDVLTSWSQLGKRKTNGKVGTDTSSHRTAKGTPMKRVPGDRRNAEWPQCVHGHPSECSGRRVPGQGLGPESRCRLWGEGDLASPLKPDLAPWHPQTTSVPWTGQDQQASGPAQSPKDFGAESFASLCVDFKLATSRL